MEEQEDKYDEDKRILSAVSEKGKIVVNKCLRCGYNIETLKLEKLLILMHGFMLVEYQKPFFKENVVIYPHGLAIRTVEDGLFCWHSRGFKKEMIEYINLLEKEEEISNKIIRRYGELDVFKLNEVLYLRKLMEICYNEYGLYYQNGISPAVPNELIEKVFSLRNFF